MELTSTFMLAFTAMHTSYTMDTSFRGIAPLYKPKGPTSHDMVYRVRKITGEKKVGHAGTLDPLAEGVLVMAVGREFTKQLGPLFKKEKEYVAEIKLGETSATDDEEGEKTLVEPLKSPTLPKLKQAIAKFEGEILQVPPAYSAVKVDGKEAYKRVRKGEVVKLEPRLREVKEIEILDYSWPLLKIRVVTGSGVYIRSLARDIGAELQVGGYLASLVRTRVGQYTLDDCYQVD